LLRRHVAGRAAGRAISDGHHEAEVSELDLGPSKSTCGIRGCEATLRLSCDPGGDRVSISGTSRRCSPSLLPICTGLAS
jgi:hypothetical protein